MCDFFFFFKQKTAYDMRISDWSSDVCSSDLSGEPAPVLLLPGPGPDGRRAPPAEDGDAKTGAPAEAGATAEEGANSGIRREPGLADHENVASEPVPEVNEFDFDRGGKGSNAARDRRAMDRAMQRNARIASLDPGDGIDL